MMDLDQMAALWEDVEQVLVPFLVHLLHQYNTTWRGCFVAWAVSSEAAEHCYELVVSLTPVSVSVSAAEPLEDPIDLPACLCLSFP